MVHVLQNNIITWSLIISNMEVTCSGNLTQRRHGLDVIVVTDGFSIGVLDTSISLAPDHSFSAMLASQPSHACVVSVDLEW